ncbi:MAG TPA: FAD-binding oxidoreductase [Terriglobia bacterium]|nr:FAD-binding oxidoreductase [Terriglobia bacterium]
MSQAIADIRTDLAGIVGEARASTEPAVCAAFAVDGVTPHCVIHPGSAEEVAEVLKSAATHELALIPCGNRTKLGLGAAPSRYDVALCLEQMKRVVYYEPDDLVMSVEPGLEFCELQRLLGEHRLWVPLDPVAGDRATIGGILAANSAGPLRLRYGGPRDMVLGMRIVTGDGKIVKTGGRVVKNVAGYDLGKLLIGSHGTLGVIVEAAFKLYPQVRQRATWAIEIGTPAAAREFRRKLLGSPLRPLRAVLLSAAARSLLGGTAGGDGAPLAPTVWIEAGGSERVMARYEAELGRLAAALNAPIRPIPSEVAAEAWARIADFANGLTRESQVPVVLKAALPIAGVEEFVERAEKEARAEGCEVAGLAQLGVGVVELGVIPAGASLEPQVPSSSLIERLRNIAAALGGSLIVGRCPTDLKSKLDVWGPPGDEFEVMRKLKAAWDPKGTLAPGRFLGGL